MTDFKLGDGTVESVVYDAPIIVTSGGNTFVVVPAGRDLVQVKLWGSGGAGGGRGDDNSVNGGDGGGGGFLHFTNMPVTAGDSMLVVVGTGGSGGVGGSGAGVSGDGGAGGGRTHIFDIGESLALGESGAGGGGGGANGSASGLSASAGRGGGGGGSLGEAGQASSDAVSTFGGGGGTLVAGGAGGAGTLTGDAGISLNGGDGADGSGTPIGANATGGSPFGGAGGAYDTAAPGGGGGGAGTFGGGGGGSGDTSPAESAGGGGGGSGFNLGTLVSSLQASGRSGAGESDPDYPGGNVGRGGLGAVDPTDNGAAGSLGAAALFFGTLSSVPTVNDLVIENDAPVLVEGIDLIAQHVRTILLICQGEWFLDLAAGTPWFQRIIGHKFNAGQINITVRDAILSVDGVASIVDIVSVRGAQPRSADIKVKVLTTQGAEVIIEAEVP